MVEGGGGGGGGGWGAVIPTTIGSVFRVDSVCAGSAQWPLPVAFCIQAALDIGLYGELPVFIT